MTEESVTLLSTINAPYGKSVLLEEVDYESGLKMLRIRIREGNRFNVLDLDADTAASWGTTMSAWAGKVLS